MIQFKQKEYGINRDNKILSGALKGAGYGATVGGAVTGFITPKFISSKLNASKVVGDSLSGKLKDKFDKLSVITESPVKDENGAVIKYEKKKDDSKQRLAIFGASTLIGTALGALVGAAKELNGIISRANANSRRMKDIVRAISSKFKEGKDFTRDPKTANLLKTKVCIVISHDAAEFKTVINTVDDKQLKTLTNKILKEIDSPLQISNKDQISNKFNEVSIATVENPKDDVNLIKKISESFMEAGYPVYLVEIG